MRHNIILVEYIQALSISPGIVFFCTIRGYFLKRIPVSGLIVLAGLLFLAAVSVFFLKDSRNNYLVLSSRLDEEEFIASIRSLKKNNIGFKVNKDASSILVLGSSMEKARLALFDTGLDTSEVVGYEIFDKQKFGTTSSVQSINKQRALVGELIRTIKHIEGVEKCRVHLSVPKKNLFINKMSSREGKASVVLGLKKGYKMKSFQVESIKNIVASAVPGLTPKNVTVVDMSGMQFLDRIESSIANNLLAEKLEQKSNYEKDLENKVIKILSRIIPRKSFEAKVTVETSYAHSEKSESLAYLPDQNNFMERKNLFFPLKNNKAQIKIQSLSASIVFDKNYIDSRKKKGAKNNLDLSNIESIIKSTIGWKKDRDPNLQIKLLPFDNENYFENESIKQKVAKGDFIQKSIYFMGVFSLIALCLAFVFFFIRLVAMLFRYISDPREKEEFTPKTLRELEEEHGIEKQSIGDAISDALDENSSFEDLVRLDDKSLREALECVSDETILLAVKTSFSEVRNKILKNLPKERAISTRNKLKDSLPGKIHDVERCQDEILSIIKNQNSCRFLNQETESRKRFLFGSGKEH